MSQTTKDLRAIMTVRVKIKAVILKLNRRRATTTSFRIEYFNLRCQSLGRLTTTSIAMHRKYRFKIKSSSWLTSAWPMEEQMWTRTVLLIATSKTLSRRSVNSMLNINLDSTSWVPLQWVYRSCRAAILNTINLGYKLRKLKKTRQMAWQQISCCRI